MRDDVAKRKQQLKSSLAIIYFKKKYYICDESRYLKNEETN